ncbi:MAG: flagellar export protein FliJ [Rubrivivax sp.]|nr:flagellar export protein FliJ [Rubrivivax sp.]
MNPPASLDALNLLLDRATQERDRLAGELRRGEEVVLRARRQGEQLDGYRGEYTQRWSAQFGRGGAIEIVHCYQSFMQRLDEALAQQQRHIDAAERGVTAVRQALLQAELRVASVKKLIERRQAEQARQQERRDQRQTDETAQHLALRRARQGLALQH